MTFQEQMAKIVANSQGAGYARALVDFGQVIDSHFAHADGDPERQLLIALRRVIFELTIKIEKETNA